MRALFISSTSASVLLDGAGDYYAAAPYALTLNGRYLRTEDRSVASLFDLRPDTEYRLEARRGDAVEALAFRTGREACALDARRFGAAGDGIADDTAAIQAAILCCPPGGRVRLDPGDYRVGPLFLKSHMTLELKRGAALRLQSDRSRFPVLPGATPRADGPGELLLGSWEGNPLDCYAAAINGIGVEDVRLIGEGTVDGRARAGDWWLDPKNAPGPKRGRLLYLRDCRGVTVQGLTFRDSPSWNLHPCFSEDLLFVDLSIEAPADSPNTDGFDPESCRGARLYGARISVGDDCVAIKSGKLYMGAAYHTPCEDIDIAWCAMLDGHGGVTVGSEMSGGVRGVRVRRCLMRGNDRGLRVKTRRGRGKYAVVDDIRMEDVRMEGVAAPLVINALYFCDPDGHAPWVQDRRRRPVDDGTPTLGDIAMERVAATGCRACAAYVLGLPERPVARVALRDCAFAFSPDARPMVPAMAEGVESCARRGVIARNVRRLTLQNVRFSGVEGEPVWAEGVDDIDVSGG